MTKFGKNIFGKDFSVKAEVTNGKCPTCDQEGLFVSINPEIFRCTTCGSDCKQYVNGSIRYLPAFSKSEEINKDVQST